MASYLLHGEGEGGRQLGVLLVHQTVRSTPATACMHACHMTEPHSAPSVVAPALPAWLAGCLTHHRHVGLASGELEGLLQLPLFIW